MLLRWGDVTVSLNAVLRDQNVSKLLHNFFQWSWKHLPTPSQIKFVLQTTENSEKRVVETQQTKLNSHYKQIKTSECWKPWQEGSKSNAANYALQVENYIFWKSSSQNAHPLLFSWILPYFAHLPMATLAAIMSSKIYGTKRGREEVIPMLL